MIRINLLPHREQRRAARQRQFAVMAGTVAVAGVLVIGAVHMLLAGRIDSQNERNAYLEAEIAKLDKEIADIKELKAQTQALLSRKQVVETLQTNRAQAVYLLDQLVRLLPDGVYLKGVKQTGAEVNVQGYAQSNARVATLIRNLEASPYLESSDLVETKAATVNGLRVSEFAVKVKLTQPQTTTETQATAKKPS